MSEAPVSAEPEEDFVPLSALQHQLFCPRQCALIHLERVWEENALTAEGRLLHENVDELKAEKRRDLKILTAVPLSSKRLKVAGVADLVELHREGGRWRPFPVEYKRGRPKAHRADEVQLCAQAICLEEMFSAQINEGALFYGQNRRRHTVAFDAELRALTDRVTAEVHALFVSGVTPPPRYEKAKCETCSLVALCRPRAMARQKSASRWLAKQAADEE